ncbi:hypothetical protein [Helicobacter sp. MIT 01-3238]|uniref:hypothetical protein n=1 Tax=Helicobacter sp. MIT 01-3238 TaxID=398627 RepID=UPI000E1EA62D|nr:hypothetical protein [Helicobacter sp. MIT 01-3238]RDU53955.1 hypothetical protein CQA40_03880 [Helicobacter sp. MIT 01-3238]
MPRQNKDTISEFSKIHQAHFCAAFIIDFIKSLALLDSSNLKSSPNAIPKTTSSDIYKSKNYLICPTDSLKIHKKLSKPPQTLKNIKHKI